jgi:hypothetical protein
MTKQKKTMRKMTAKELVVSRLGALRRKEEKKPGTVRGTPMFWAFVKAIS